MDPRTTKVHSGRAVNPIIGSNLGTSGSYNTASENVDKSESLGISLEDYYSATAKPHHTFGSTMLYRPLPILPSYAVTSSASVVVPADCKLEKPTLEKPSPQDQPFCRETSGQSQEALTSWGQLAKITHFQQDIIPPFTSRCEAASRDNAMCDAPRKYYPSPLHTPKSTSGSRIRGGMLSAGTSPTPHLLSPTTRYGKYEKKGNNHKFYSRLRNNNGSPQRSQGHSPSPHPTLHTAQQMEQQTRSEGSNRKVPSNLSRLTTPFVPFSAAPSMGPGPFLHDAHHGEAMAYHNAYGFQGQGDVTSSTQPLPYDPYTTTPSMTAPDHTGQSVNPYQDASNVGGTAYYSGAGSYTQPVQYHLYAPQGPHREKSQPNQRTAADLFISNNLREDLQKKSHATLQVNPNLNLPAFEHFHALLPLDHGTQRNAAIFGYPSWIYKVTNTRDANTYALRRLEGYRFPNEKAVRSVQQNWKRVCNGNVVTVIKAFTTGAFGDNSLIFVTDYHPLSETLTQKHLTSSRYQGRQQIVQIQEHVLWGYIVQIANALKAIHTAGLAARILDPSKIILTGENRIRLNACAILDVVQHDSPATIGELQRDDLHKFGRLILALGINNQAILNDQPIPPKLMELFCRNFSPRLRDAIFRLPGMVSPNQIENIDIFLSSIASDIVNSFDSSLHQNDNFNSELARELENSRLVRLVIKINFIIERPEYENNPRWFANGEMYYLKLFRDIVFHQVDVQGFPVLDLYYVISLLNKLDAGSEEKITLTSRDDQSVFVVSYKELKKGIEGAYADLMKMRPRA